MAAAMGSGETAAMGSGETMAEAAVEPVRKAAAKAMVEVIEPLNDDDRRTQAI